MYTLHNVLEEQILTTLKKKKIKKKLFKKSLYE